MDESADHILVTCLLARTLWWMIGAWVKVPTLANCSTVKELLQHVHDLKASRKRKKVILCVAMAGL
ncbi:hypothetical protein Hanom_Chr12g01109351 [Helianthus anomalus]